MSEERTGERRRRVLSDDDLQALAETFRATHAIPHELHQEHHEFIATWIEKEKREQERWEKVKAHVFGWAIVAAIGGICAATWQWLKSELHR